MTKTLAQEISMRLQALHNCNRSYRVQNDTTGWQRKHRDILDKLDKHLPTGAGLDAPPKVDQQLIASADTEFYIHGDYHHMNEDGVYDGWIKFMLKVRATFGGVDVDVHQHEETPNWDDYLAEHICETFQLALSESLEPEHEKEGDTVVNAAAGTSAIDTQQRDGRGSSAQRGAEPPDAEHVAKLKKRLLPPE